LSDLQNLVANTTLQSRWLRSTEDCKELPTSGLLVIREEPAALRRASPECDSTNILNQLSTDGGVLIWSVLVQPEMEKRRSPLVSIPPFGRGFSRHGVFRSDGGWAAQERALTPPFIVSMSPPGYPSAWVRPRSARFRFARHNRCNSATSCRFSTSGLPVTPPEPRPARPES
jgi:hypothetical protein